MIGVSGREHPVASVSRDLTVKALAKRIDGSSSLLSMIERDVSTPSIDLLREIAMQLRLFVSGVIDDGPTSVGLGESAPARWAVSWSD